jgi:benzylsuccinate CoA-transferase BbsF subunit
MAGESRPVADGERQPVRRGVLEGLRVFELSIAIAAPSCGRYLLHHGAEVIKVESPVMPDVARLFGSAWARDRDDIEKTGAWLDTGPYVSEMSAGKKSVGLDLKHPDGIEAARRLLAHCDIFLTNYSAPAVAALGLGYEDVRRLRSDVIYTALPGFGCDPAMPYYHYLSWGPNQAPLVGMDDLTGYPDQEPAGIASIAPPDYCAGLHAFTAVLAALRHRDRTGEGTLIDVVQYEATIALLGPFLMDYSLTGRPQSRTGNRQPGCAPEGVYPCRGVDRWVAISITSDGAWQSLCAVAGHPEWADDARFATVTDREAHHDELDELLAAWTARHSAEELAGWLQVRGVAAYPVHDNEGLLVDPQIRDRRWYQVRPNTRMGRDLFGGIPQRLTRTPGETATAGPEVAEHTLEILRDVAGYSEADVEKLVDARAAFLPAQPDLVLSRPYDPYLSVLVPGSEEREERP